MQNEDIDKYFCGYYKLSLTSLQGLKDHLNTIHKDTAFKTVKSRKPAKCDKCDKVLSSHDKLLRHIKSVHEIRRDYECDLCGKKLSLKENLKTHMIKIHKQVFEKLKPRQLEKKCNQCNKEFASPFNLRLHVKNVHDKRRDYECCLCGKKLTTKTNLKKHNLIFHSNKKPVTDEDKRYRRTEDALWNRHYKYIDI